MSDENQNYNSQPPAFKREDQPNNGLASFLSWGIKPALIGMVVMFILGKIIPAILENVRELHTMSYGFNKFTRDLDREFGALSSGNFSDTNLWILALLGIIIGWFVKLTFGDDSPF